MSERFLRLHVCDVIQFRDDHAATRFWRWKFRIRNSCPMDRISSILQWRLLKFNCCLLCFQAAVFCYFLFSKRHFVLRGSSSDDLAGRGVTSRLISLFQYLSFCVYSTKQRQGLQICVVVYHLALPRSMIVTIEQITWNQLHWWKLLHASYIFLLRLAGKTGVFYSADKRFETGADPRNIFDKQSLKVWTPCLSAFYCVIPRATLAWSLKACAIARFSKSARARTKNYREPP